MRAPSTFRSHDSRPFKAPRTLFEQIVARLQPERAENIEAHARLLRALDDLEQTIRDNPSSGPVPLDEDQK